MSGSRVETPRQLVPLPAALVDELARGYGGADAVRHLALHQQSLRRRLLAEVCALAARSGQDGDPLARAASGAVEVLRRLDADARCHAAVAEVLAHPCLQTWAVRLLEQPSANRADPAHLASVAGAAAIRAGADADVTVPVRHGAVHLPTLGRLVIAPHQRAHPDAPTRCADCRPAGAPEGAEHTVAMVDLHIRGGSCSITAAPAWQAVRAVPLLGLAGGALAVEDTDPHRVADGGESADRVPRDEWEAWRRTTVDAWDLLRRDHARHAAGIAAGLSTLIPLDATSGVESSAAVVPDTPEPLGAKDTREPGEIGGTPGVGDAPTPTPAFGSVGAVLPRSGDPEADAAALALQLIRGFQHSKLGAVLAMADLHEPDPAGTADARTREWHRTLWQDTYAQVAVTDFWRFRFRSASHHAARDQARAEFARCHEDTARRLGVLTADRSLTALGRRFADALTETVEGWAPETR